LHLAHHVLPTQPLSARMTNALALVALADSVKPFLKLESCVKRMFRSFLPKFGLVWLSTILLLAACSSSQSPTSNLPTVSSTTASSPNPDSAYTFGMLLVGPNNDFGWSQAHYEGAKYAEAKVPGTKFIFVDKVNPADRPGIKVEQIVDDLVNKGAKFIISNSDDFKDGTREAAKAHPDVLFLHVSGDDQLTAKAPKNLGNVMGKMEYGKMIAGCAAALQTKTGKVAYLGPLINDETRRLVNAAFLGANYCWQNLRADKPSEKLDFSVTWIGFWFNIPGTTLDPTVVANEFINAGHDVIISGVDTTEALVEANKATKAGKEIFAIPYDFKDACKQAPAVCLGVPYFNWGPYYVKTLTALKAGSWKPSWEWLAPDWKNLNDLDTTAVGFLPGPALAAENKAKLDEFIAKLAGKDFDLFVGPLNFQDGTVYLKAGEKADEKKIWYMSQLLEGIKGKSK